MFKFTTDSGIYVIKNVKNGKSYIGSAVNLRKRISQHKSELKNNIHHSRKLQNSWNKHGSQYFIFDLVELVPDKANLVKIEQFWIDMHNSYFDGYNCNPIAGSSLGLKHTDETKIKMSESAKNRPALSEESRAKISYLDKLRIISSETRDKQAFSNKGQFRSDESRAKMSESAKNRPPMTDETRTKLSLATTEQWAKKRLENKNNV